METNSMPSALNTEPVSGASAQLANVVENKPNYDGATIDQMRGNPLYQKVDEIDKLALAQNEVAKNVNTVKAKSKLIRSFNEHALRVNKPKQ